MASTYAGSASVPADLTIADDGDAPSVANIAGPIEQLKDEVEYLYARVNNSTIRTSGEYGSAGSIEDTISSVVATTVQYDPGGGDVDIEYTFPACITNDDVWVMATFGVASTPGAQIRIRVEYGAVSEIVCTQYAPASGAYVHMCLQGVHSCTAAGTATFTIEVVNAAATNTHIYGPVTFTAIRSRTTAS